MWNERELFIKNNAEEFVLVNDWNFLSVQICYAFFLIGKNARTEFYFGNFKAVYYCPFVYFVGALLTFCCMYILECVGDAEVINEQILINSRIQAIGDAIDFYVEESY